MTNLIRGGLIAVMGACLSAAPCFADAVINFNWGSFSAASITSNSNTTGGSIATFSENENASWSFAVSGASVDNGTWNVTGGQFTLGTSTATCGGSIAFCYLYTGTATLGSQTVSGTLFELTMAAAPTDTVAGGATKSISVSVTAGTSLTANTTLLHDIGIYNVTTSTATSGTIASTAGFTGSGPYTWTPVAGSQSLALDIGGTAPEPVSVLLFGSGLLIVGLIGYRKRATAPAVNE